MVHCSEAPAFEFVTMSHTHGAAFVVDKLLVAQQRRNQPIYQFRLNAQIHLYACALSRHGGEPDPVQNISIFAFGVAATRPAKGGNLPSIRYGSRDCGRGTAEWWAKSMLMPCCSSGCAQQLQLPPRAFGCMPSQHLHVWTISLKCNHVCSAGWG